ncbi:MAG: phosphatidylserine decarboxylase family protein [Phycisphaerales bacterium]
MKIAHDGWPVIGIFFGVAAAITALALWLSTGVGIAVAVLMLVLCGWCLWFFRDPDRNTPQDPDAIISPADGVVIKIDSTPLPSELAPYAPDVTGPVQRVIIFLNVFNVHVNRAVASGRIEKIRYTQGKFLTASVDKASLENERCAVLMRDKSGRPIVFSQIAGLVARRIVNHLREGQEVNVGDRYGLIRFGSRAEIFLPPGTTVSTKVGDKVVCGETILAKMDAAPSVTVVSTGTQATTAG